MTEEEFRFKDTTRDERLLEILRANLALHRRRARTWTDQNAAVAEAVAALTVRERILELTGERNEEQSPNPYAKTSGPSEK